MTGHFFARTPIPQLYRWFACEAAATSPLWNQICLWIADESSLHARLDALPGQARQPQRFLAALQYHQAPLAPEEALLEWINTHWRTLDETIRSHTVQTNEPGRLAAIAPLLAELPQPVALLELGAAAGLCLLPDLLGYPQVTVAARLGVDANPLDASDPDTRRWLRALVWPGEREREERLCRALDVAAAHPPEIRRANLCEAPAQWLPAIVHELAEIHPEATVVVMHSMTLGYLPKSERGAVIDAIRASQAHWIAFEPVRVLRPFCAGAAGVTVGAPPAWGDVLLSLDGVPRAWCQPHGNQVQWFAS